MQRFFCTGRLKAMKADCKKRLIINATLVSSGTVRDRSGLFINEDGRIADVFSMADFDKAKYGECETLDVRGSLVTPGLIDTHIHGIGGYGPDDCDIQSVLGMSEKLMQFGVTAFFPTLYAGSADKMERETREAVKAIGKESGARILGINLEGPFLNPKKCGAQDPKALTEPDASTFLRLVQAGEGHVKAMTIAPELPGVEEIVPLAERMGVVLLMGHTDATYEQAVRGMNLGIHHATHTFNAMSRMDHKNPGVAGCALFHDAMHCELIADGVHVHRDLVSFLIKTKPQDKVVLITDSLKPTALGPGRFVANGDPVVLGERGAFVMERDSSVLCGSALTLNTAVRNVTSWTGNKAQAVRMATENPATVYGFGEIGALAKGKLADIAVFDEDFNASEVFVGGKLVYKK